MRIDGLFHCHTGRHADGVRQGKVIMDFDFDDSDCGRGAAVSSGDLIHDGRGGRWALAGFAFAGGLS